MRRDGDGRSAFEYLNIIDQQNNAMNIKQVK